MRRLVVFLLCFVSFCSDLRADERPNIVFILADDLGYGDLGCYGCTDIRTPHLDQLAKDGIRFTDFYANGSVCSPTRAAFMTGRYQQRIGMDNALYYQEMDSGLPVDGQTIADALKYAGYATGLSGKWHLGYDFERRPTQQGFDHFFGLLGGNHHYFAHMDRIGVPDLWLGNQAIQRDGYTTDMITSDAIGFIERYRHEPFFLYLSHAAPHFPWQGPDDADKVIEPKKRSWQEGDRETYVAMVERMDQSIGDVLSKLDELGLRERTLIVFTSDNGGHTWSRNAPLSGFKSEFQEGGIRVPCIARWPGVIPSGATTKQVGITMDWTATFRQLAGLPRDPAGEDGVDLLSVLKKPAKTHERTLFWRHRPNAVRKKVRKGHAVRHGKWKLVEYADGETQLFDLARDLAETNNLVTEQSDVVAELRARLEAWENDISSAPVTVRTTPLVLRNGGTEDRPAVFDGQGMVIDLGIDVSGHDWKQDGDLWTSSPQLLAEHGLRPVMAGQIAGLFIGEIPITIPRDLEAEKRHPERKSRCYFPPEKLQPGQMGYADDGSLYFRWPEGVTPGVGDDRSRFRPIILPPKAGTNCVSIACSHIVVRNLTVKHAGNDGFNIHGHRKGIRLENVRAFSNADEGISAHETVEMEFVGAEVAWNGSAAGGIADVNDCVTSYRNCRVHDNAGAAFYFSGRSHAVADTLIYNQSKDFSVQRGTQLKQERVTTEPVKQP